MPYSSKYCVSLEEVDTALAEIENKYKVNSSIFSAEGGADSTRRSIKKLYEEFECLGIPVTGFSTQFDTNKIIQELISNALALIGHYRKERTRHKELNATMTQVQNDSCNLQRKIEANEQEMNKMDKTIKCLNLKMQRIVYECNDLQKENNCLKQKLLYTNKISHLKETELQHQQKKLISENLKMQDALRKNIGTYVSRDEITAEWIGNYKINEEAYKASIKKLHENNTKLLEEIASLREQILYRHMVL